LREDPKISSIDDLVKSQVAQLQATPDEEETTDKFSYFNCLRIGASYVTWAAVAWAESQNWLVAF